MHDGRCYLQWPSCISFVVYDCYMAALAHNVLQMVRSRVLSAGRHQRRLPGGRDQSAIRRKGESAWTVRTTPAPSSPDCC